MCHHADVLTGVFVLIREELVDLVADLTIWDLDVVLLLAVVGQEVEEAILGDVELIQLHQRMPFVVYFSPLSTYQLVLLATDVRHVHVVGGRGQILQLLAGEQVDGGQVNLGVTVLAGLGGGHVDDLARAVLDHDEAVLAQGGTLHWEGERGTGVGALEGELML